MNNESLEENWTTSSHHNPSTVLVTNHICIVRQQAWSIHLVGDCNHLPKTAMPLAKSFLEANHNISLLYNHCRLYVVTTINILLCLGPYPTLNWQDQNCHCICRMIGTNIHHVKEYEFNNNFILEKSYLNPQILTYIWIRQLRFLTCITHMEPTYLPIQVLNTQATVNGKCSQNVATMTRRACRMALEKVGGKNQE
jgi:hypothetical protein